VAPGHPLEPPLDKSNSHLMVLITVTTVITQAICFLSKNAT